MRPSTKLRMRGYKNPARGELVEPCILCGREKKSKFGDMSRSRMSAVSQL